MGLALNFSQIPGKMKSLAPLIETGVEDGYGNVFDKSEL
jgi:hypothetical protein